MTVVTIVLSIACFIVGGFASYLFFKHGLKNKYDGILRDAEIEKLEAISGLSAEEAKERMVESLKEEAKTQAQSYINDIMDDAKLTASKEAKRIVIQSIQRVATETAIENSVTVFHI